MGVATAAGPACSLISNPDTGRVSVSLPLAALDRDADRILRRFRRFDLSYDIATATLCLRADPSGDHIAVMAGDGPNEAALFHFPRPLGMGIFLSRVDVETDSNITQGTILIDLPARPLRKASGTPPDRMPFLPRPPVDVTRFLMGDPIPGRSALDAKALS